MSKCVGHCNLSSGQANMSCAIKYMIQVCQISYNRYFELLYFAEKPIRLHHNPNSGKQTQQQDERSSPKEERTNGSWITTCLHELPLLWQLESCNKPVLCPLYFDFKVKNSYRLTADNKISTNGFSMLLELWAQLTLWPRALIRRNTCFPSLSELTFYVLTYLWYPSWSK